MLMQCLEPIVALDVDNRQAAVQLLEELSRHQEHLPIIKIGMELYYALGPEIVNEVRQRGMKVFLDLKLYDIPNTVRRAMKVIGQMGVAMVTVHAAGGSEMLKAAKQGLKEGAACANLPRPKLLAITELTSIDETILHREQLINGSLLETVQSYARLAQINGLDGVVCSAHEVPAIRQVTDPGFLCITPGIRASLKLQDDQKRIVTPRQARKLGSNGIVVGRPITRSKNPAKTYRVIRHIFMEGDLNE